MKPQNSKMIVQRLTLLWAFSEAALGGVLHLFKIPLTGLFVGGAAVLLISLIAFYSHSKGEILKATLIVLIVKGLVSPHAPITSYAAAALQGSLGVLLFQIFNWRTANYFLSVLALVLSSFQKFLVVTLVFGVDIWTSIDLLGNYIVEEFTRAGSENIRFSFSLSIIVLYSSIHLLAGILVAILTPRILNQIERELSGKNKKYQLPESKQVDIFPLKRKKRRMIKKISSYILYGIIILIMALSYVYPVFEESYGIKALIMFVRSIVIMSVWYFLFAPLFLKVLNRYLAKKRNRYTEDVEMMIHILPQFKQIALHSWRDSFDRSLRKRIEKFILFTVIRILTMDLKK
jgi:hypothetical protein